MSGSMAELLTWFRLPPNFAANWFDYILQARTFPRCHLNLTEESHAQTVGH